MSAVNDGQRWGLTLNETLVLGCAPVLGAALAYSYECGAADFLGLPFEVVQIDLPRIIFATSLIAIASVPMFVICGLILSDSPVRKYGALGIAIVFGSLAPGWSWWATLVYLAVLSSMVGFIGFAEYFNGKSFKAQWHDYLVVWGVFALFVVSIGWSLGAVNASAKTLQFSLEEKPSFVLVRRYGDGFYFREVDIGTGLLKSGLEVQSCADGNKINLRRLDKMLRLQKGI